MPPVRTFNLFVIYSSTKIVTFIINRRIGNDKLLFILFKTIKMTYLEKAQAFQSMLQEKGSFETFERYYAENCEVTEVPTGEVRKGKSAQREAIKEWFAGVDQFNGAGVNSITSNEETATTMIESWMDITFKNGHRAKMNEVGVQKWEGDQIVSEKFYYNLPS